LTAGRFGNKTKKENKCREDLKERSRLLQAAQPELASPLRSVSSRKEHTSSLPVGDRPSINCWEDRRVVEAVKKTGRNKLVMAALWTEMCLAMPAIHAMGDGYDVYVVTDASGGVSPEAHDMAVRRMTAAGAQPITWLGLAGELQRDWARTEHLEEVARLFIDHAGATGSVFLWETQLLGAAHVKGG
jgi:hypothetical protein